MMAFNKSAWKEAYLNQLYRRSPIIARELCYAQLKMNYSIILAIVKTAQLHLLHVLNLNEV